MPRSRQTPVETAAEVEVGTNLLTRHEAARLLGVQDSVFEIIRHRSGFPASVEVEDKKFRWREDELLRWSA